MARDQSKPVGGAAKPNAAGNASKAGPNQSAKDRSRAQSRPVSGKAAGGKTAGSSRSGAGVKGGNTPRPGRPGASSSKPPRGVSGSLIAWGAVALVVVVILVLVVVKLTGSSSTTKASATPVTPASASLIKEVTSIPASVFNTVGVNIPSQATPSLPITLSKQPPLTLGGRSPSIFYFGAEYCPFCAAERWGVVTALSRFGTWKGLDVTASSSTDYAPNTPTFSFRNVSYSSPYVNFVAVENCTNIPDPANTGCSGYTSLQSPTKAEQAVLNKYSSPTYIKGDTSPPGTVSFPFMDVNNQLLFSGATYSPLVLASLTHAQIAGNLTNTSSSVTQAIVGTANLISAGICAGTKQQPSHVCASKGVLAADQALKLG